MRLVLALTLVTCMGCLSPPPVQVVTDDGQVVTLTPEQRVAQLEQQYQQAKQTIEELKSSASFLPPGMDIAGLAALTALSGYLEKRRRQLLKQVKDTEK